MVDDGEARLDQLGLLPQDLLHVRLAPGEHEAGVLPKLEGLEGEALEDADADLLAGTAALAGEDDQAVVELGVEGVGVGLPVAGLDAARTVDHEATVGFDEGHVVACLGGAHSAPNVHHFALGDNLQEVPAVL